jgi:hypothetical protein
MRASLRMRATCRARSPAAAGVIPRLVLQSAGSPMKSSSIPPAILLEGSDALADNHYARLPRWPAEARVRTDRSPRLVHHAPGHDRDNLMRLHKQP